MGRAAGGVSPIALARNLALRSRSFSRSAARASGVPERRPSLRTLRPTDPPKSGADLAAADPTGRTGLDPGAGGPGRTAGGGAPGGLVLGLGSMRQFSSSDSCKSVQPDFLARAAAGAGGRGPATVFRRRFSSWLQAQSVSALRRAAFSRSSSAASSSSRSVRWPSSTVTAAGGGAGGSAGGGGAGAGASAGGGVEGAEEEATGAGRSTMLSGDELI